MDKTNNFPHILRLVDSEEDISDQFFIAVEKVVLLKCQSISTAVLLLLSVHYIFNIEYNPKIRDVLFFIQEYMLGLNNETRKSAAYLSFTSAISCHEHETTDTLDPSD